MKTIKQILDFMWNDSDFGLFILHLSYLVMIAIALYFIYK